MAKHVLTLEEDYDYDLLGICSHHNDYRICWALNDKLSLQLKKSEEPFCVSNKKGKVISEHSFYEWFDENNHIEYYFIKNKGGAKFLISEKPQVDYFLVLRENYTIDVQELLEELKNNSSVITAFIFDPSELKSAENLIF